MNNKRMSATSMAGVLVVSLTACGGGGGDNNPGNLPSNTGPSEPTATYLFYQGSIGAVDSASPASPISVEAGPVSGAATIFHGTYTAATHSVSDLHPRTAVYAKDGKLWKVSALKGSTPAPVRLSSEDGANTVCDNTTEVDFVNHNNAAYIYSFPGVDAKCYTADDTRKMVKVGMSGTEAPIDLKTKRLVTAIMDSQTGALKGWLATDGSSLSRYDANFGNAVQIANFSGGAKEVVTSGVSRVFLKIDDKLRVYNAETGSLSASLHTYTSNTVPVYSTHDASHIFFVDGAAIYKLPTDGSASATLFTTESGAGFYMSLELTANRLVYIWSSTADIANFTYTMKSSLKTAGLATTIIQTTPDRLAAARASKGGWVYYSRYNSAGTGTGYAGAIKDDGNEKNERSNAFWAGYTLPASGRVDETAGPKNMILAEGYKPTTGFANGSLTSFDALTNTSAANLGTIPSDISGILFFGFGDNILGRGGLAAGGSDIFFINTAKQSSLTRVTNTSAIDEFPM